MRLELKSSGIDKKFVWYWLQSSIARDFIRQKAKGTSPTMKKITQATVLAIPFPSSLSLGSQEEIVKKMDIIQSKLDRVKSHQERVSADLDVLLPSILSKAFAGEL